VRGKDIREIFSNILSDQTSESEPARKLLSLLVDTTLNYRDEMRASKGVVVTVEDVRFCLKWLVPALATGNIPHIKNDIQRNLLRLWIHTLQFHETGRGRVA